MGLYNYNAMVSQMLIQSPTDKLALKKYYETAYSPEKMFCKSKITEPVMRVLNEDCNIIINRNEEHVKSSFVLRVDHANKRITTNDNLTIINMVLQRDLCKLSFGVPSDLVIF